MDYFNDIRFTLADVMRQTGLERSNTPSYFGIQYIRRGRIRLQCDREREQHLDAPVVFLTAPDHYFEYGSLDGNRDHYWICFLGERCRRYLESGLFVPGAVFPVDDHAFFPQFRHLMELVAQGRQNHAVPALELLLVQLLESRPERGDDWELLRREIAETPEKDWDFHREARNRHISYNYFNRLFRRYCGTSPHAYLVSCRLRRAARLLLDPERPLREVAGAVGIGSEYYFSRLFKAHYGISPGAYRKEFKA